MSKVFQSLASIDVSKMTEKKNGLTYLSWAHAWAAACGVCDPVRTVYKDAQGRNYHTDGFTCWVEVGVTIEGIEHIDMLPVMDYRNQSIPADKVTSFDVNKAIQRSTAKALALHGLGLNVYAGEDLPMVRELPKLGDISKLIAYAQEQGLDIDTTIKVAKEKYTVTEEKELEIVKAMEAK